MNRPSPAASPRVALVAPNWLGDAVMSRALPGMLVAAGARVCVVAPPYTARIYAGMPGVDDLVVDGAGGRIARIRYRTRALRALSPDAVVVMPPSFSSALPAFLARAPIRAGDASDARGPLLTHRLDPPATRSEHLSETFVRLGDSVLRALGLERVNADPAPLFVGEGDREEASRLVAATVGSGAPHAVIVPGAAYGPAKTWPQERFRALCARLAPDVGVLVAGSAREKGYCDRVAAGEPGVYNVAGATSLGGFLALLEGAAVVVANDSGSPHAAAALGTPTVTLFGSTSPSWTAPVGARVEVLQHPVHCNPCFRRTCPTELECFRGISVESALAAARSLAGVTPGRRRGAGD